MSNFWDEYRKFEAKMKRTWNILFKVGVGILVLDGIATLIYLIRGKFLSSLFCLLWTAIAVGIVYISNEQRKEE